MKTQRFLSVAGSVMVLLGVLGFLGILGPSVDKSAFHQTLWLDVTESWMFLALGVISILAGYFLPAVAQIVLVWLIALKEVVLAIMSLTTGSLIGAHFERPAETILFLIIAGFALWSVWPQAKSKS